MEERYAHGRDVRYAYNEGGLLTGIDCGDEKVRISYDGYGRISSKRIGSSETRYSYNGFGYLASLVNTDNGKLLDSYEYAYDVAGNLTSSKQVREGLPAETGLFEYGYDAIGRLNTVTRDGSLLRNYLYDAFGNRTSLSENGGNTVYEYNKANQLIRAESPNGATSFEYDKRGNVVRKSTAQGVSINYTYGAENRLIQAIRNTGGRSQTAKYVYNGLGMRVSRITDDGSVDYILDQTKMYNNLLEKVRKERAEEYIWYDNDLVMAGEEQVLTGRLSTVERAPCMAFGAFAYDEFGVPLSGNGSPTGFTGYIHDDIADTYFAQAREYMPEIGRFAGRDILKGQIEIPRSLNEYAYCHNEPIGFVDFNGMEERKPTENDYVKGMTKGGLENAGSKFAEDKLGNSVKHWEKGETKNIYREFDHDIRVNSNRALNSARPGRAAGAASKLEQLQATQAAKLSRVGNLGKVGRAAAKWGPSAAIGAASVGYDYYNDYNSGLSSSKIWTNAGVNAAYAVGGIGATAVGTSVISYIATVAVVASPPGWVVAGLIGIAWGAWTVYSSNKLKNRINSLD